MRHENDVLELQLLDDGVHVTHLVRGRVGIPDGLARRSPAEKVKHHHASRR